MDDAVRQELARARNQLLDLSLRNRLLNFRPSRRTTIQIVDELPREVWRLLVVEGRKLSFLAREEHALQEERKDRSEGNGEAEPPDSAGDEADVGDLFALPVLGSAREAEGRGLAERHVDRFLQTPLRGEELQTNLLRIDQQARSALDESGVNLLFLAMGFLEWTIADGTDRSSKAPLLLIPVGLTRTSAKSWFKLSALDEEPASNPCLRRKLLDFGVELPAEPDDWQPFDPEAYFDETAGKVQGLAGFRVLPEMFLGFFSYTKYLMYLDLDLANWPGERDMLSNPLVRMLCGDYSALADPPDFPRGSRLDELDPEVTFTVLDADATQLEAVEAAKRGLSFVIEGPPGTGKSQTIANIVAECLAAGRTVLFVSEKMAALEVVKRRLDQVGLGDFCLELHSTKASRRTVVEELKRVLEKGRYGRTKKVEGAAKLRRLRKELNNYVSALHEPFGVLNLPPYEALGRTAVLADVSDVVADLPGHEDWDRQRFDRMKGLVDSLRLQTLNVSPLDKHLWRGTGLVAVTPELREETARLCAGLTGILESIQEAATSIAAQIGVGWPGTLQGARELVPATELLLSAPDTPSELVDSKLWDGLNEERQELVSSLRRLVDSLTWMKGKYRPESLAGGDWAVICARWQRYRSSPFRWLRPAYWADRSVLKGAREPGHCPARSEAGAELGKLAEAQTLQSELVGDLEAARYFGSAWRGSDSDWPGLLGLADWLTAFRRSVSEGRIGASGIALAAHPAEADALRTAANQLAEGLAAWDRLWPALRGLLSLRDPGLFDASAAETPCSQVAERLTTMAARTDLMFDWARYQGVLAECLRGPLGPFLTRATEQGLGPEELPLAFEKRVLQLQVERAFSGRKALAAFQRAEHDERILTFARLDREWISQSQYRLHGKLALARPDNGLRAARTSELGVLLGEIHRKRGGRSIRTLLRRASNVIQQLKPCFMMSPLSVAQFLNPEGAHFDVVVFDEASQVEPADALGAIARGTQLVLVGDPKQLPPTSFFTSVGGEAERPDDEGAGLADMESVLDKGLIALPSMRLRWHYRSRHQSLITFSNTEFYDDNLVVFPSSHADTRDLGLQLVCNPEDLYSRGRGQINRSQARRIAEAVFEHARRQSDVSLGVGAFSQNQQQAILDEVEKLRQQDDSVEEFFSLNKTEPFFVKNLETIQGDERDVLLLSVGYGKTTPEDRLSMNFGPLNRAGGWRRLNVLITRARRRCVIFSSIRGEDFDLSRTQARGVFALKNYLDFAESGELPRIEMGDADFGSPFEQAVYAALTDQGVDLVRQVGCVGYAIDLAVVDPERPGRLVLGIECDGATYHGSATARDRDRLRQQVLEGLGWRIHRVWSTEWYRSPQEETRRALEAIEKAKAGALKPKFIDVSEPVQLAMDHDGVPEGYCPVRAPDGTKEYRLFSGNQTRTTEQFYTDSLTELAGLVVPVVKVEGPIHEEELIRRISAEYGFGRTGRRVRRRIADAISLALRSGVIARQGSFLWPPGLSDPPVRHRTDDSARDIDLVCLEEIGHAAQLALKLQYGMTREDLIVESARLLGFQRTGSRLQERIGNALDQEIGARRIVERNGLLALPTSPS